MKSYLYYYYYFNLHLLFIFIIAVNAHHLRYKRLNALARSHFYRIYSKSSSAWKSFYYNDDGDNDDERVINTEQLIEELIKNGRSKKLSTPDECARPCQHNIKPKTCYYRWTFEFYHTLGGACQLCEPTTNTSLSSNCDCILADGVDVSGIIVANRMYPGPSIQVCLGDIVVVDVINKISGNELTIHWHGIYQQDWQHYDGVPFVTQCPIAEGTTFRYQWRAQNPGTHFWHAHTGFHKADGVDGAIIIRQSQQNEPNRMHYDEDNFDNIIFLSDWLHRSATELFPGTSFRNVGQRADNLLINGKGQWTEPSSGIRTTTPLAVINVRRGIRYRFRIINACAFNCPVQLTIENHDLTIIGVDGEDVEPQTVTTITTFAAERVDIILDANKNPHNYWIQVRGLADCAEANVQQHAILRYTDAYSDFPEISIPLYNPGLDKGVIFNDLNEVCDGTRRDVICVKDLHSADPIHEHILRSKSDMQIFLSFSFFTYDNYKLFGPQERYQRFVVPNGNISVAATFDGIANVFPPSPLISQLNNIPRGQICNKNNLPAKCRHSRVCECTHVINIPLNAVVDIILIDGGPNGISHPFHLHGFGFHVMGQGLLSTVRLTEQNKHEALELHRRGYPQVNYRPPTKDTLAVASGGYTIVRFIADNPGWWLYHCHFLQHLFNGMMLVFQVGDENDLPPTPNNFPTCGNHLPEIYKSNPQSRKSTFSKLPNAINIIQQEIGGVRNSPNNYVNPYQWRY